MKELLISLGYNFDKKRRKRRTKKEIELEKQCYENEKFKYENDVYNEQYNLDCLWSHAYSLFYSFEDCRNLNSKDFIIFIDKLKDEENIDEFWNLIDVLKDGAETTRTYFEIRDIKNFLSNDSIEVQEILDSIKTSKETSIVIESLIGTEHITMLEKGHGTLKKYKQNKNKKGYVPYTYETALRKNRHMLESYLKEIGVGQQRAQKISQILAFL